MTIKEAIDYADTMAGNKIDRRYKIKWLSAIEARVQEFLRKRKVQITMFPGFMAPKGKRDGIGVDEFVRHICHAVDVVGIDHVGVGCDFDGGGRGVGLNGANDAVNLTMKLIEKGFSDEDIAKIWGGNFFRVLDEVQAKAGRQIADN